MDQWVTVLLTDEFRLIWREPGTHYLPSNVRDIDSYGGESLMVWSGIMLDLSMSLKEAVTLWGGRLKLANPSENHPKNENRVAERVEPIATRTDELPYFNHDIPLRGL
ncbi:uncharacterized protein TNCV_1947181 [Trichonephila clavipes]|nr:uncharacterized protein TNCV_1947181 [Trichonephila clavipes]